jgi:hypothetical protein
MRISTKHGGLTLAVGNPDRTLSQFTAGMRRRSKGASEAIAGIAGLAELTGRKPETVSRLKRVAEVVSRIAVAATYVDEINVGARNLVGDGESAQQEIDREADTGVDGE